MPGSQKQNLVTKHVSLFLLIENAAVGKEFWFPFAFLFWSLAFLWNFLEVSLHRWIIHYWESCKGNWMLKFSTLKPASNKGLRGWQRWTQATGRKTKFTAACIPCAQLWGCFSISFWGGGRQWWKNKVIFKISFSPFYHCVLVKSTKYHSHHRTNIPEHLCQVRRLSFFEQILYQNKI